MFLHWNKALQLKGRGISSAPEFWDPNIRQHDAEKRDLAALKT